jgi:hypothetical protein
VSDALERVLQLVADGKLSAEEAAPILDALSARSDEVAGAVSGDSTGAPEVSGAKFARITVMEGGRRVVDLRVPTSLGHFALGKVPGLSADQVDELRQAISTGRTGPLLEVEDPDGDGVKIVLE